MATKTAATTQRATTTIKAALAAGRLFVVDPTTGFQRAIYARCPRDGHAASVWRVVRGPADAVVGLTMHCPICGQEFEAGPEALYLQ